MTLHACRPLSLVVALVALAACRKPEIEVYTVAKEATPAPATTTPVDAPPAQAGTTPAASPSQFKWTVPAEWTVAQHGAMQQARFTVPEVDGAQAEVSVSVFPSDTGGTLANVNRWRGQIGLPPVDEAGLASIVAPLSVAPGAVLADLHAGEKRMLAAIVPRQGLWWFYKLTGGAPAVAKAREAFIGFVSSRP